MWYFVLKACLEHNGFDSNITILAVMEDNFVLATTVNDAMLVIMQK